MPAPNQQPFQGISASIVSNAGLSSNSRQQLKIDKGTLFFPDGRQAALINLNRRKASPQNHLSACHK
jgi:hypothetical protein